MIVGTAGHIDHGKTALVKALTGVDGDRLAEERARGITIELGFAYADLGAGAITGFVDVPGHERLVHTMLAGAGGIDVALLVVAADDGVMPQTREHVAILDLLGLSRALVAITKADLATPARIDEVAAEVHALLAGTALAGAPVYPVSSLQGCGVADLRAALAQAEATTTARAADGLLRFAVDRSFSLSGTGTVVTGIVLSGQVEEGDEVLVSPQGLRARVRGLHAQQRRAGRGLAGQRCALNLAGPGVEPAAIHRGDVVLAPALHAPTDRIDVELDWLAGEARPATTWFPARLHVHAREVGARVVPLAGPVPPGARGLAQLVLESPIAAAVGERFVLRDTSASRTVGGGRLLDLRAPARRRGTPGRLALLAAAQSASAGEALRGLLAVAPIDLSGFLRDRALPEASGDALLVAAGATRLGPLAVSAAMRDQLAQGLAEVLGQFHEAQPDLPGLGRERLRLQLTPRLSRPAFLALLQAAAARGDVVLEGSFVRLPGHVPQLSEADEALWRRIRPQLLGEARFRPPRVRDLAGAFAVDEAEVRRVLRGIQRRGQVDQVAHDHFFDREVVREMVEIVRDVAAQGEAGWFGAPAFRDRVHNGRKVAIQILDFFDQHGLTLRKGDLRRINPHRADLFDT